MKARGIFMTVERYGSKTDVVVKLVLVFFIALLSFSIGTFVGKKFSDNQHKLAQLEPEQGENLVGGNEENRAVASVHPDSNEVKPEKALTDDEIAKLAEEFVTDDEKPSVNEPIKLNDKNTNEHFEAKNEHGSAPVPKAAPVAKPAASAPAAHAPASTTSAVAPAAHTSAATRAPEVSKPAARMIEGKSPVVENPAKPTSRIPASLPKEVASSALGKYTVQVAAYNTEKEAQGMSADLKSKGFSAFYVSASVKGQTWYRVSVGLFSTLKEADAYKKDLIVRAKVSSAIVQKITSAE
jgi:cell division protein FtsN